VVLDLRGGSSVALYRGEDSQLRRTTWVDAVVVGSESECRALVVELGRMIRNATSSYTGLNPTVSALCPQCVDRVWMAPESNAWKEGALDKQTLEYDRRTQRYVWPSDQQQLSRCYETTRS
jgi:hypothetical protein